MLVVGAGHNGLVCAAYLAAAGCRVTVLEAAAHAGGCAATVDALGTRVNVCNCDHVMIRATPIIDELGLERIGLRYLDIDPAQLSITRPTPRPWFLFHDVERTLDALRLAYPAEVDGYRRYLRAALPVARLLIETANAPPTPRHVARVLARRHAAGIATLLRWSRSSALGVLRTFFTCDALIAPALTTGPVVWGVAPSAPRTGLGALGYAMRHLIPVGRPAGGSGALITALCAAIARHGGDVRTGAEVTALLSDGERVRGVELAGGAQLECSTVIVACDPAHALVHLLRRPSAALQSTIARYRTASRVDGYESKIDAVVAAAPVYRGLGADAARLGVSDAAIPTCVVTPGVVGLDQAHASMLAGRVPEFPPLLANVPSVLDPEMRAGTDHLLSLEALCTPYARVGGWQDKSEPRRWLTTYQDVIEPGFTQGVRRWRVMTPPDYEREQRLPRGHAASFSKAPLAALLARDRELSRYETSLRGLFLTGAATFPGAGIWGASGRNAAGVVLRRLA